VVGGENLSFAAEDGLIKETLALSIDTYSTGQRRIKCPSCSKDRTKHNERTLSIQVKDDYILYKCHHCDLSGRVNAKNSMEKMASKDVLPNGESVHAIDVVEVTDVVIDADASEFGWLADRGIDKETIDRCKVVSSEVYLRKQDKKKMCVGFVYDNEDGSRAYKWRDESKGFSQTGAANTLWRINEFQGGDIVICEGEIDAMSYDSLQIPGVFATSVPNGAPSARSNGTSHTNTKYKYLWHSREMLAKADRILVATDSDAPGRFLAEEIVRRVGKGKCFSVAYPDGCKDANDVLVRCGSDSLRGTLSDATPWPVAGIRDPDEFRERAMNLYNDGLDRSLWSGIPELDSIYRVAPQTLCVVTGIPGSGKSSFMTFMSVTLASKYGWRSVIMSSETPSEIHILQMASIYIGKPFHGANKMTEEELSVGLNWVQEHFTFLDESDTNVESVIDRAAVSVMRYGARIIQIDPYNFLTNDGDSESTVNSINRLLVGLKKFSVSHDCVVFVCAHPTKMYRMADGSTPRVGGYDVSGSAAWFGVSDSGLTISRDDDGTMVTCWKSRFPWLGELGDASLSFDPETGIFRPGNANGGGHEEGKDDYDFSF